MSTPNDMKIDPIFLAEDADVILITSDGAELKIQGLALIRSSEVFKNVLTAKQYDKENPAKIVLTDKPLETFDVVRNYLRLVYLRGPSSIPEGDSNISELLDFIKFLKLLNKYEAEWPIDKVRLHVRSMIQQGRLGVFDTFLFGAHLKDPQICMLAIASEEDSYWDGDEDEFDPSGLVERHVLDFPAASLATESMIPGEYRMALNHVHGICRG